MNTYIIFRRVITVNTFSVIKLLVLHFEELSGMYK